MVFVVQRTSYMRGREGKWMLEEDENGDPSAVFELTRANRPRECDAAPDVGAVVLGPR